ncbi:MAG: hypothetical protein ACXWJ6_17630 [Xanthobacteraceae bacterium]
MKDIAGQPDFQQAIHGQGLDVTYLDAKASGAFWRGEIVKWGDVIK